VILAVNGTFLLQQVTGVQRYAIELCAALAGECRGRHRILLLAPLPRSSARPQPPAPGIEVRWDSSRMPPAVWVQTRLPRLVRSVQADVLWSPANVGPVAVRRQAVTVFDAAVFASPEGYSWAFRTYYRRVLPLLGRRVERVITISDFSRDELVRWGVAPRAKVDVVPCGVSPTFRPDAPTAEWKSRQPYVLFVGSLEARKNLATLLRAWSLVAPGAKAGRRLLAAGGTSKVFGPAAGALTAGAFADVEMLGYVPDASLPGLYAGADLLVYPSLYEGFGLPPLEAMACGTPVLASNAASLPEVCGDAACFCDPRDASGMARALEELLADEAARKRLRLAGLERARGFTWRESARRLLDVLESSFGRSVTYPAAGGSGTLGASATAE